MQTLPMARTPCTRSRAAPPPAEATSPTNAAPSLPGAGAPAGGPLSLEIDAGGGTPVETLGAPAAGFWSASAPPPLPEGNYSAFAYQLSSDGNTTYTSV